MRAALFAGLVVTVLLAACIHEPPPWWRAQQAMLGPAPATAIVLEVDAVPGHEPDTDAVRGAAAYLARTIGLPIRVETGGLLPLLPEPFHVGHAAEAAQARFDHDPVRAHWDGGVFHVQVASFNGAPDELPTGGGVAWFDTILLFFDIPDDHPLTLVWGDQISPGLQRSLIVHEIGHAMGLVDNGIPMVTPREDPEHPYHSLERASVMFNHPWVGDLTDMDRFMASDVDFGYRFDAYDIADIRAYQAAHPRQAP